MKRMIVMQQGGHKEHVTEAQRSAFGDRVDFIRLNWAGDMNDKEATYVSKVDLQWSVGRQLLYELACRDYGEYEYYCFLDDDVSVDGDTPRRIFDRIDEWKPLCLAGRSWRAFGNQWGWDEGGIEDMGDKPIRYLVHDEDHMFLHRSVMQTLFPLMAHGVGAMAWFIEKIVHDVFNGEKNVRCPELRFTNIMHRSRGVGHGPTRPHRFNALVEELKSAGYKKGLRKKRNEKEYIGATNSQYVKDQVQPIAEKKDLTEKKVGELFDISKPVWTNRRCLLPVYEKKIVRTQE